MRVAGHGPGGRSAELARTAESAHGDAIPAGEGLEVSVGVVGIVGGGCGGDDEGCRSVYGCGGDGGEGADVGACEGRSADREAWGILGFEDTHLGRAGLTSVSVRGDGDGRVIDGIGVEQRGIEDVVQLDGPRRELLILGYRCHR